MEDFINSARAMDLLQSTHDSVVELGSWIKEHEKMHMADSKAYLKVYEVAEKDLTRQSDAIMKLDIKIESIKDKIIYISGFAAAIACALYILEKLNVI